MFVKKRGRAPPSDAGSATAGVLERERDRDLLVDAGVRVRTEVVGEIGLCRLVAAYTPHHDVVGPRHVRQSPRRLRVFSAGASAGGHPITEPAYLANGRVRRVRGRR